MQLLYFSRISWAACLWQGVAFFLYTWYFKLVSSRLVSLAREEPDAASELVGSASSGSSACAAGTSAPLPVLRVRFAFAFAFSTAGMPASQAAAWQA